jgi:phosphatidate cytidylyltransferase
MAEDLNATVAVRRRRSRRDADAPGTGDWPAPTAEPVPPREGSGEVNPFETLGSGLSRLGEGPAGLGTAPSRGGSPGIPGPGGSLLGDQPADGWQFGGADGSSQAFPSSAFGDPVAPAERPSRAGRNLTAAIAVGVGLGGAIAASLFIRKEAFVVLASAAIVLGVWELAGALTARRISIPVIPLAVGSVGMLVSAFVAGEEGLLVAFALTAFGSMLWRIIDGLADAARDVAAAVFTAAYVPFLAGFAMLMLAERDGAKRIVVFILLVVANDVGGYVTGVMIGRHPMAPSVSPKKSWEGFAGSLVTGMAAGATSVVLLLHGPWWAGVAVGAAAVVTATLGDLSESLLKRDLGIKDMGNLLPGHGGLMDRLDSLLPTAPAVYLLLELLVTSH